MINFNNENDNIVADNKVSFCGVEYLFTDTEAQRLKAILDGMVSSRNAGSTVGTPADTVAAPKKAATKGLKDLKYHVKKLTGENGKELFCISRGTPTVSKNGKTYLANGGFTAAEKACVNAGIKALDGITTIRVKAEITYSAWGYKTRKQAEAMMSTLPTSYTAEQVAKFQKKA